MLRASESEDRTIHQVRIGCIHNPKDKAQASQGGIRVDWKVLLSTFGLIFFAELGDKTQLTTMMLAAQSDAPSSVFVGAAIALSLSALLGVVFGEAITKLVPTQYIHLGAGIAFVGIGVLLIVGKL